MTRVILLVIGYCFGLIQTGYLYGRLHGIDIRSEGSGNSGATNSLRVLGKKAGLIVFVVDLCKSLIPCIAVRLIFQNRQPEMTDIYMLYMAIGVILGHNYPFYLKFRGGKGISSTAGFILAFDLRISAICLAAFICVVFVTRYVSLGSLVVVTLFFLAGICFGFTGLLSVGASQMAEFIVLLTVITALAFWRHRGNIVRLIHGNENKIGGRKAE